MTTPIPAHDEVVERAVIGTAFLRPSVVEQLRDTIRASQFYRPELQAIWQAMLNCHGRGEQIDSLTLTTELARIGKLESVGKASFLEQLLECVPDENTAPTHARRVRRLADQRELADATKAAYHLANRTDATEEQIGAALSRINSAWQSGGDELPTLTAREICKLEFPANTDWLIERWWAWEACGWIAAHEKSSKTVIALGMALSVATGSPWLWRWRVTQGPVVFVAEEDHKRRVQRRLRRIGKALGLDPENDNLHIAAQEGCRLSDARGRGRLAATVRSVRPVWLIVDPFRRVTPGVDENDSREVSEILDFLRCLQVECKCAVSVLDHKRKPGQGGTDSARGAHKLRGTGDKGAWYDSFMEIVRKDETTHIIGTEHRDAGVGPLARSDSNPGGELTLSVVWDDEHDELRFNLPGCAVPTLTSGPVPQAGDPQSDEPPPWVSGAQASLADEAF